MELILYKLSLAATIGSCIASLGYLFKRFPAMDRLWRILLAASVLLHLASFVFRTSHFWSLHGENQYYLPISSFFGAMSFLAFITNVICFILSVLYNISVLGAFVLPLSLAAQASAWALADPVLAGLAPTLQSYWINIHPLILMSAYGALANGFGISAAFLIQEGQLKSRRPKELTWQIPALEVLDGLTYRMIFMTLPVLTLGIVMGGIWAWSAWGRFWGWDAKETWSLVTWMIYIVYLHLRLGRGLRGRSAVWVNFAGFASVLFTFLGVNFLSRLHGYL